MRRIKTLMILSAGIAAALAAVAPRPAAAGPALLFDSGNGNVLYAEDPDNHWHPASLTKIMTAYVVFQAIKAGKITMETKIACSEAAHVQPPSKIGLPVGAEMTVDLALQALIVKSANDVAVMLAEAVGGSEAAFVAEMNAAASRLGMSRSHFVNPNGLPAPDQVTTARDLAKLSRAIVRDFPEHAHYWSASDVRIGKLRLRSHNSLLKTFDGADGLKTGFICDSGFNVVASATRDGRRLMAVVLGEPTGQDRAVRAASLLEHGFQSYDWKSIFSAGTTVDSMPMQADAKGVMTVRETVLAWECGNRRRGRVVANGKRIKAKQAQIRAKAEAAKKGAEDAVAPAARAAAAPSAAAVAAPAAAKKTATGAASGATKGAGGSAAAKTAPAPKAAAPSAAPRAQPVAAPTVKAQ